MSTAATARAILKQLLAESETGIVRRTVFRSILHMHGIRREFVITNAIKDLDLMAENGDIWERTEMERADDMPKPPPGRRGPIPGQRAKEIEQWVRTQLPCTMAALYANAAKLGYGENAVRKALDVINPTICDDW